MTQANETESGGLAPLASLRRESGVTSTTETRGSRVLLRIPGLHGSAVVDRSRRRRLAVQIAVDQRMDRTMDRYGSAHRSSPRAGGRRDRDLARLRHDCVDAQQAAGARGSHAQRPGHFGPASLRSAATRRAQSGPRANVQTDGVESAAKMASRPNAPATVSPTPTPQYENARLPAGAPAAPGKPHVVLEGTIQINNFTTQCVTEG